MKFSSYATERDSEEDEDELKIGGRKMYKHFTTCNNNNTSIYLFKHIKHFYHRIMYCTPFLWHVPAITAGGYDVLLKRHLYSGSMIVHLCVCWCTWTAGNSGPFMGCCANDIFITCKTCRWCTKIIFLKCIYSTNRRVFVTFLLLFIVKSIKVRIYSQARGNIFNF